MPALSAQPPLVLIDVQQGFDNPYWGRRNNPGAEQIMHRLLRAWRHLGWPVVHVQHLSRERKSPLRPGQPGCELKELVRPLAGESVVQKSVNSAFIGTDLETRLRALGSSVVLVGLTTDHCVSTSARMAANLGFNTYLVADATATFDRKGPDGRLYSAEEIHAVSLASLHGEFATVLGSGELLDMLPH